MNTYLEMQKNYYNREASNWSLQSRDPVVGSYDRHNNFYDYDEYLFPKIDTSGMIAIEYGCGPGRNLIRFKDRFKRIDGVDIAEINLEKAKINLESNHISDSKLFLTTGDNIPTESSIYDVVFSVICLQHICVHSVRMKIMEDCFRVLKDEGYFCFQMGYGSVRSDGYVKPGSVHYYDNHIQANATNGDSDTRVDNVDFLINDLKSIGFKEIRYHIGAVGPGDSHGNWIWVQAKK